MDRFTNEQMERMVFDKDYNPLKEASAQNEDAEEDETEEETRKAELKARFAAAIWFVLDVTRGGEWYFYTRIRQ